MTTIKTLENTTIETILVTFNKAFSDYTIPMQITQEQLESKIHIENIKLEYSVGAFENNELIAFILHGHDILNGKLILYNGATGVIPSKRGNNLTLKLYEFLIPLLREKEISFIKLEVITTNKPAISTYKKAGFSNFRELACYKGIIAPQNKLTYEIKEFSELNWEKLTTFWDWSPSWQNDISAIENSKNQIVKMGIFDNEKWIGYVLFNSKSKKIQQFAVDKSYRNKGVASQLFSHIGNHYTTEINLINIESTANSTITFLEQLGLQNTISQYEMVLEVK